MTTLTITTVASGQTYVKVIDKLSETPQRLAVMLRGFISSGETVVLYRYDGSAVILGDGVKYNSVFEITG